ncbi:acyl-CoA dehydrogenase family protein [Prosthecomicrobium sp. N25]|uniref:acyl-CoA dehydrogenase family protein n=1 Tax=Prosthecomicrobium sp. N25 TaxID=3129254 RepID=UPI0030773F14
MTWRAPVDDILFAMAAAGAAVDDLAADELRTVVEAAARFAEERIAPLDLAGDRIGARFENGLVATPPGWGEAYRDWCAAGWNAVSLPEDWGGAGLPVAVGTATMEILTGASMAFGTLPVLTHGAVSALAHQADPALRERWLPPLVAGRFTGAMDLTEPQAGSDLSLVRTRAEPDGDGLFRVTGAKCFITFGEHDMADNIVHLVLARLPDASPGTRGLSLLLVPKYLPDADGRMVLPNAVACTGLEHKLGIRGSPTCSMAFDQATGWLVGEPHRGLAAMFTMMNEARLATGLQGVAVGERAMQAARAYAGERRQGRLPSGGPAVIADHPDVRRMLGRGTALISAARLLCYRAAAAIDRADRGAPAERGTAAVEADLLTPVVKAWCSDAGVEAASLAIQVHGGAGYLEATGVARHWRDARIAPIYEGTNGIQAIDLATRKLGRDGGVAMLALAGELRRDTDAPVLGAPASAAIRRSLDLLAEATEAMVAAGEAHRLQAAMPYLRLAGTALAGGLMATAAHLASGLDGPAAAARRVALARIFADEVSAEAPAHAAAVLAPAAGPGDFAAVLG